MARTYGPRANRTRNRIYSSLGLLIIVIIIVYIYSPFGSNSSETQNNGPITNSNDTTIYSDFGSETENQNDSDLQPINDGSSLPDTSPNWNNLPDRSETRYESLLPVTSGQSDNTSERTQTGTGNVVNTINTSETTSSLRPAAPEVNTEADKLISEANALLTKTPANILGARDKLNDALRSRTITLRQTKLVKDKLSELADQWLFNRSAVPGDNLCEHYRVPSGARLKDIGDEYKVPYEFIMHINKITDDRSLQAGQTIKVVNGPFHAKVYRSSFTMDVYLQNTYVRTYTVGLGMPGSETPTGLWRVEPGGKLIQPEWKSPEGRIYYPSDPDYPLGSRWIALEGLEGDAVGRTGFAIHGTHKPEQLGTAGSQGCIRMQNGEAIMVYNMLFAGFSTVEVLD